MVLEGLRDSILLREGVQHGMPSTDRLRAIHLVRDTRARRSTGRALAESLSIEELISFIRGLIGDNNSASALRTRRVQFGQTTRRCFVGRSF